MAVPVYRGKFTTKQAERLLWRAGFGPKPGEARELSKKGLKRAVLSLTRPKGTSKLVGPPPKLEDGPLAPADAYGHDLLWWLDRMVRSNRPLTERMTLVWHDWFATAGVGQGSLNIDQNRLFRRYSTGSFQTLLIEVTRDPAMLVWLSGTDNAKEAPNENYGREMMELFTLGANADYSERDVREQARALTGWTSDYEEGAGRVNFHFDPERHDEESKTIFGKRGKYDWRDSCNLCLRHPDHDDFFIRKLWSYFIPTKPPSKTLRQLKRTYRTKGYKVRPVLETILMHPAMYEGPRMVKPPIVQIAGMLRARKAGLTEDSWVWIAEDAGQRLFEPPNVAGWDEERWLDTARVSGRWSAAANVVDEARADDQEDDYPEDETAAEAVRKARRFWGNPSLSDRTEKELLRFAKRAEAAIEADWQESAYRALRQNALRMLIGTCPDIQTS